MTFPAAESFNSEELQSQAFISALASWRESLGESLIIVEDAALQKYGADCGFKQVLPKAVVLPNNFESLQIALRVAHKFGISVHASSAGKNWGYGSASPVAQNAVIFDLRNLNRITELNRELAYVVIEPGVTQQQLFDHLKQHAPDLCMDVTGASPDSSLIGNLVERGYGQTPNGDRFQNSSGMEVLLADGTVLRTGFWHYSESKSHHLYKWGLGPYLDGIFTQSNFGIVTKVGLWLMPKPASIGLLLIEMNDNTHVARVTAKLKDLKLRGLLPATVHISNSIRLISCFEQFPYSKESGKKGLSAKNHQALKKNLDIAAWNCFTSLRGSPGMIKATLKEIRTSLRGLAKVEYIDSDTVKRAKNFRWIYQFLGGRNLRQVNQLYKLVSGEPSFGPTLGAYWRSHSKPSSPSMDPLTDNCGIAWCAPVIPSTESEIVKFLSLVDSCMEQFGFETNLTLTMLSDRALCCTIAITFDRNNDYIRAKSCYRAILDKCMNSGYIPYRHGINIEDGEAHLFKPDDSFWKICKSIKSSLDERHILMPGKYGIW